MSGELHVHMLEIRHIIRRILIKEEIQLSSRALERVAVKTGEHLRTLCVKHLETVGFADEDAHVVKSRRPAQRFIQGLGHLEYLTVAPWRTFLSWSVPVALRLVYRADVRYIETLVHKMSGHIHKIVCIIIVAVFAQIRCIAGRSISLAVQSVLNKRRIREQDELVAAAFLSSLHEILVSGTFPPVI